VTLYFS